MTEQSLRELLNSWENLPLTIQYLSDHPEYMKMLVNLSMDDSVAYGWRFCWMMNKIHDKNPNIFFPYLLLLIDNLQNTNDRSKIRELLRLIASFSIPENKISLMLDYCMQKFTSGSEPVAIRVHAMQILYNISEQEPDLKHELAELIAQEIEFHPSAGIQSRGSKLIRKLKKQIATASRRAIQK